MDLYQCYFACEVAKAVEMPLLGRSKASGQSAKAKSTSSAANSTQAARAPPSTCDSPLFGPRRQILSGGGDSNAISGNPKEQKNRNNNDRFNTSDSQQQELNSVPQRITREQIHYAFSMMDGNKDGLIDIMDLNRMLANIGLPIDEAILSYIMTSTISKRGDQRISETEFLDWLAKFIQVNDGDVVSAEDRAAKTKSCKIPVDRRKTTPPVAAERPGARQAASSTHTCLVAHQPADAEATRNRRGSGSGLALMRSLSSGGAGASTTSSDHSQQQHQVDSSRSDEIAEVQHDLKAAFCVFDLDGDGFITIDEVRKGLKLLGETSWSTGELIDLFSRSSSSSSSLINNNKDLNRKHRINIDEFVRILM